MLELCKNKYPQRQISDIEGYLAKSNMSYEYTWGTDCEIMTAAYMFGIDIFVAIDDSRRNTKIIWHKYAHSSHPDKPSTGSTIYIQNHHYHFEPVVELDLLKLLLSTLVPLELALLKINNNLKVVFRIM